MQLPRAAQVLAKFLNLEAFAPSTEWEFISKDAREGVLPGGSDRQRICGWFAKCP
jgi:hypothetical protein